MSNTGLHRWSERYATILSDEANQTGRQEGRLYTPDDITMLWTVKALRDENLPHDDILARLKSGYRVDPPFLPDEAPAPPAMVKSEVQQLLTHVGRLNEQIEALKDEINSRDRQINERDNEITSLKGEIQALERMIEKLFEKGR